MELGDLVKQKASIRCDVLLRQVRSASKGGPCWRCGLVLRISFAGGVLFCLLLPGSYCSAADGKVEPLLARIKAVRKEGAGNPDAAKAWRDLVQLGPAVLLDVL